MSSLNLADIADEIRELYQPNAAEELPYVGLEHIEQQTLRLAGRGKSSDTLSTKRRFRTGDVLFGTLRPYFRKVILADDGGVCSTDIAVLRPKSGVSGRFLQYLIASDEFIKFATGTSNGTRMPRAKWSIVSEYPLPDTYNEVFQEKVGSVLGAYDDLIQNNLKRIDKLEQMARLLLHSSNKAELNEVTLAASTSLIGRGISPAYDEAGLSIVINQRCIRGQKIDLTAARRQSKSIPQNKLILQGDILINSTGVGTLGRVAQVYDKPNNITVDSHVTIVRPNSTVDTFYFGAAVMERQSEFERLGIGATGQTELGREAIGRVVLLLPKLEIQKAVGEKIKSIRELTYNLQLANLKLRETRDLLLPRALAGDIEV